MPNVFPFVTAGLLMLALLTPAYGAESADEANATTVKEKMICKRTQRTGTRFYSQICKTALQWEEFTEQHMRDAADMANRRVINIARDK